jgi:hypothetical protein
MREFIRSQYWSDCPKNGIIQISILLILLALATLRANPAKNYLERETHRLKQLEDYLNRRTDRAWLAQSALKVCQGDELAQATEVINKTAYSARDIHFLFPILTKANSIK